MEIVGLQWLGSRTRNADALVDFYSGVLGLRQTHEEPGLRVFTLPDGSDIEVFGIEYEGQEHFDTGPVAGFAVRDLDAAVAELKAAGVELLGEAGSKWQHFRGPDGNVYELVKAPEATRSDPPSAPS